MRNNKIQIDISRIDKALEKDKVEDYKELYEELFQVYKNEIEDLKNAMYRLKDLSVYYQNVNTSDIDRLPEKEYPENYKKNLIIIKSKLELWLDKLSLNAPKEEKLSINITNNNDNNASNKVDIKINISFEDVKNSIKAMEDSIGEDEVKLINQKIDELQKIIESNIKKSEKWEKIKNIGKWIFDKSVDVGLSIIPLLLKI